jgi:hypothetical protein
MEKKIGGSIMFYACLHCLRQWHYLDLIRNAKTGNQNSPCCGALVECFDENGEHINKDGKSIFFYQIVEDKSLIDTLN